MSLSTLNSFTFFQKKLLGFGLAALAGTTVLFFFSPFSELPSRIFLRKKWNIFKMSSLYSHLDCGSSYWLFWEGWRYFSRKQLFRQISGRNKKSFIKNYLIFRAGFEGINKEIIKNKFSP